MTAETETEKKTSAYEALGEAAFHAIGERFYDLMDSEPEYKALREMHAADLSAMRAILPRFLIGWAGGPRDWFEANPGKCMMSMHAPFPITKDTANQWAEAMQRAIADVGPQPEHVAKLLSDVLGQVARNMGR